ncbi:MAG: F0F1 ATP synthase subunit delta [Candidatus Omnitrophica bacterium]|nr:F0F1 ATP synthase subunit delta [Candidatus Omnitrophota bacterium]
MLIVILGIVVLIMFAGGLLVLFRQMTTREMARNTAHLQALSQEYLKKQEELKQRVAESDRHYREQIEVTKTELERMRAQAVQEAEAVRQQIIAQARQESEEFIQKAMESREALKQELEESMERRILEAARRLTRETLSAQLRGVIQGRWLDELIDHGLANAPPLNSREGSREACVVSAVALTQPQRQRLQQRLNTVTGGVMKLQEAVDPELIAGMIITIGHTVLDGSLRSRLEQASRQGQNGRG